jgi:SAM-dependent methyltransferase
MEADPPSSERHKSVRGDFDAMSGHYQAHRSADPAYLLQVRAILSLLLPPAGRTLDMGCGTGDLLARLPASCSQRIGMDLSDKMFQRKVFPGDEQIQFVQADACGTPFSDSAFDSIVSLGLIEYVWPELAVVREMRRLLRPGGQVVLCFPHGRCLARRTGLALKRISNRLRSGNRERSLDDVITRPTSTAFDAAMADHGFKREASHFLFPQLIDWPLARWFRSADNRLGVYLDPIVGRVFFIGRLYVSRWRKQ